MADLQIVEEWLKKADEDFLFAVANLEEESIFHAQICFHFQQAAEKYLKAFIVYHDLEFEKAHNLIYLLKVCHKKELGLKVLYDDCEFLNTFYIETRYPVHWPTNYSREKAVQAKEAASRVGAAVRKMMRL